LFVPAYDVVFIFKRNLFRIFRNFPAFSCIEIFFVFTARTQNKQYWRVETKDFYTGKGWKISENPKNRESSKPYPIVETFCSLLASDVLNFKKSIGFGH
jgi:hypothetical protein